MGCRDVGAFKSDEKIYQALHANGKSSQFMLAALKKKDCFTVNQYEVDKKQFEIRVNTVCAWEKLERV